MTALLGQGSHIINITGGLPADGRDPHRRDPLFRQHLPGQRMARQPRQDSRLPPSPTHGTQATR